MYEEDDVRRTRRHIFVLRGGSSRLDVIDWVESGLDQLLRERRCNQATNRNLQNRAIFGIEAVAVLSVAGSYDVLVNEVIANLVAVVLAEYVLQNGTYCRTP